MDFLNENLDEETSICEDILKIRLYFKEVFPFQSEVAKNSEVFALPMEINVC